MAINVKLEVFEGPLDLLLHLIDKNKVDIYDIPIVDITKQYLEYIQQMKMDDMNVKSEFLLMAATLIDIKCKMLLPKEVTEDGEIEDPREELVKKLLEYKMYKYMSYELKDKQVDANKYFFKEYKLSDEMKEYREPIDYEELVGEHNLKSLHALFQSMLRKQEDKIDPIRSQYGKIEKEEIDIEHKTNYIYNFIRNHKRFSFKELLEKQNSKMEIVVTFLIILEEMKIGTIQIVQEDIFSDIMIEATI